MENGIIMGFQETMGNKGEKRSSAISPKPYVLVKDAIYILACTQY